MSLPSQVSVIDVAAVGDVLDTFPVCASPISCIVSVPEFDSKDPDVLAGERQAFCVSLHFSGFWCFLLSCDRIVHSTA